MYDASNRTYPGPGNGITGGNYDIYGADRRIPRSMTAFTAIAWYNSIEILVLLLFVFKKYSGLYFWSLLITNLSVVPYATGAWMKQNNVNHNETLTETLLTIGWVIMLPGQSIVLYSRLHLISQNEKLLRFIFWLIIVNAVVLCTPTVALNLGSHSAHPAHYIYGYSVMEKIQMTLFTAQEFFISGIYLWEVRRVLKVIFDGSTRKIMWQLVAMNVLIIVLDTTMLTVEFFNFYMIETTMKSLVYSVKLKIEFGVLSNMVSVVTGQSNADKTTMAFARRLPNIDTEKLVSSDLSLSGEGTSRKCSHQCSECTIQDDDRGLQQNLPPHWRLSISHETPGVPNLLEIRRKNRSPTQSLSSIEKLYPGRLS